MAATKQTISATGATLVNTGGTNLGPDGLRLQFDEVGAVSIVLSKNTAPPGSTANLVTIAYQDAAYAVQSAGTAITADGLAFLSAENASLDIWATVTVTSGYVVVTAAPADIGGGGSSGGTMPAGDVTAGTFGSFAGETGAYNFPGNVGGTLTTAAQPNVTSLGTLTALQVDNLNVNGNTISSTAGTDLLITPLAGQQIVLDGAVEIDAGVVTGITALTATAITGDLTGDVTGDVTGNVGAVLAAPGAGIGASRVDTSITQEGDLKVTRIFVELTGLASAAADDVIGLAAGGAAFICRIPAGSGTIIGGTLRCFEAPVGGDADIDVYSATAATGAYNDAISGVTGQTLAVNSGTLALTTDGSLIPDTVELDDYLYLVSVGATADTYTAGRILLTLYGI